MLKMRVKNEPIQNHCFTCLCQSEDCMQISVNAIDSESVTVVEILTKHFWFQRDEFVKAQHVICENCWNRLDDFHRFYQEVQENHAILNRQPPEQFEDSNHFNGSVQFTSETAIKQDDYGLHSGMDTKEENNWIHSEIEIKEEYNRHQPEDTESKNEESTACSLNEEQNKRLGESLLSDREMESERRAHSGIEINEKGKWTHYEAEIKEEDSPSVTGEPNEELRSSKCNPGSKQKTSEADKIINAHRQYNCTVCEEHFKTFNGLKMHIETVHGTREGVVCCGKRYATRLSLLEHVLRLADPNRFKCDICGKVLANSKAVRTHKQEVHVMAGARKHHCNQCPRRFARARALTYHIKQHLKDKAYISDSKSCPFCKKRFRSVHATNRHIKVWHERGDFACDVCETTFVSERNLQRHILQHNLSLEELRAQCNVCHQWFKTKNSLAMHSLLHTAPEKCDICGLVLEHHQALTRHKRQKHKTD